MLLLLTKPVFQHVIRFFLGRLSLSEQTEAILRIYRSAHVHASCLPWSAFQIYIFFFKFFLYYQTHSTNTVPFTKSATATCYTVLFSTRYSSPVVPYPNSTTILCGKQNGGCHAGLPVWSLPEVALPRGKEVVHQSHNNYSAEWTVTSVEMVAFPMRPLWEVAQFCVRK